MNNSQNNPQHDNQFVPLIALLKNKRKVVFDGSVFKNGTFRIFAEKNSNLMSMFHNCYVPAFVLNTLDSTSKQTIDTFIRKNSVQVLDFPAIDNYNKLLLQLANIDKERGNWCFIVGRSDSQFHILQAAQSAKIFVQFFSITDEGKLTKDIPKPNRSEQRDLIRKPQERVDNKFEIRTTPERISIRSLAPVRQFTAGDFVFDSKKQPIRLMEAKIHHPNAVTYSTNKDGVWAKIYLPTALNTFLLEKTKRMLSQKIEFKGLCWPIDLLTNEQGIFVGTLVPPSKGEPLQLAIFKQAKLLSNFPNWNKRDLCDLTLTILRIIQYLHSKNILLGCLNPAAIRVVSKEEVYFLDTDNYQIEGFPTLVYNTSFTPPELLGRKIYLCKKENENYAIAMMVFMLMMTGKTPYTLGHHTTVEEAIKKRQFPFPYGNVHGNHALPGMWRFMWSHLTPLKELFYNTFQRGGKYDDPANRKSVDNWIATIKYFRKELENPSDPESLKIYPKTFKRTKNDTFYQCQKCGVWHPKFYFDSRYFNDYRICNSCIDKRSDVSFTCKACNKTYYYTNRTALFHHMKKIKDADWRDQKYCTDCKRKTVLCIDCHEEKPYYLLKDGRCPSCSAARRNKVWRVVQCKDCGRSFNITVGDHEFYTLKGLSEPTRCKECRDKRKNS
jgi:hypothetical protein